MPFAIPALPDAITPDWLTHALCTSKTITKSRVITAYLTRIGEDQSFTGGRLFLVRLAYNGADPGAPVTLIAKLSPAQPDMRRVMRVANGREVAFYRSLAQSNGMPLPRCFHADFDPETGASILLLQDLTNLRAVPFTKGCGPADAKRVVEALAELHARWWNNPALADLNGAPILTDLGFSQLWQRYKESLAGLLQGYDLPTEFVHIGNHIAANDAVIFAGQPETAPFTRLHRDVQSDNILFAPASAGGVARLLDWQLTGKGRGAYDVGYFLISSLAPAQRRNMERGLVAHYHARLLRLGITDYSLSDCWADYLQSVAGKLFTTVAATVLLDNSGAHKKAWRKTDLARLIAFCKDHGVSEQTFAGAAQK